jgi:hypothetical protein
LFLLADLHLCNATDTLGLKAPVKMGVKKFCMHKNFEKREKKLESFFLRVN